MNMRKMSNAHEPMNVFPGDGRNDSPGHSAKYCTYSLMEQTTQRVVAVAFVDKRETALKSPNMELLGLKKIIERVDASWLCHR